MAALDDQAVSAHLAARVATVELGRRLPGAAVVALAPQPRAGVLDGGEPVAALGPWTEARRAELAAQLDALGVLAPVDSRPLQGAAPGSSPGPDLAMPGPAAGTPVGDGSEPYLVGGLGAEHQEECPSVLLGQGALAALAAACLPYEVLDRRLAWLTLMGWYPPGRRCLMVNAEGMSADPPGVAGAVSRVGRAHRDLAVVVIGSGAQSLAGQLADDLGPRVAALTGSLSLEDVAAVHRAAGVVIGCSTGAEGLARAYGRPFVAAGGSAARDGGAGSGALAGPAGSMAGLETAIEAALGGEAARGQAGGGEAGRYEAGRGEASRTGQTARGEELARDGEAARGSGPALSRQQRLAHAQLDALAAAALASASSRSQPGRPPGAGAGPEGPLPGAEGMEHWAAAALQARSAQRAGQRLARAEWVHGAVSYRAELEQRLAQLRLDSADGYARYEAEIEALRAHLARARAEGAGLAAEGHALRAALTEAEEGRSRLERELRSTHATRLFRWASGPRRIYGALRRRWLGGDLG